MAECIVRIQSFMEETWRLRSYQIEIPRVGSVRRTYIIQICCAIRISWPSSLANSKILVSLDLIIGRQIYNSTYIIMA